MEKDFNLESLFDKGKKYLVGKSKDIKLAIENYEKFFNKLNVMNLYKKFQKKIIYLI